MVGWCLRFAVYGPSESLFFYVDFFTGSLVNWYVYLHDWLMFKVNGG